MWFRFSGSGDIAADDSTNNNKNNNNKKFSTATTNNNNNSNNINNNGSNNSASNEFHNVAENSGITTEGKKPFDKFRRASFRRKSNSIKNPIRKRSNSPHSLLKGDPNRNNTIEEGEENLKIKINDVNENNNINNINNNDMKDDENKGKCLYYNEMKIPIINAVGTDAKPKMNANHKKDNDQSNSAKTPNFLFSSFGLKNQPKFVEPIGKKDGFIVYETTNNKNILKTNKISNDNDEADTDEDDDDDDDDDDSDSSSKSCQCEDVNDAKPQRGKEKLLLIDPKFRNNRIEKCSSKTKVTDFNKKESIKRSSSARKIMKSASNHSNDLLSNKKAAKSLKARDMSSAGGGLPAPILAADAKRKNCNLNFQSLVKFMMNQKKFTPDDCALMRRKSIVDAVTSVMSMGSSCKPLPTVLKYPQSGIVADTPRENDSRRERNVILVKKQNIHDSLVGGQQKRGGQSKKFAVENLKINRNESTSSRSSGNYEDEAFYSADETDYGKYFDNKPPTAEQKPNNSLKSRMAAKINEKTNAYRTRKSRNKTENSLDKQEMYRKKSPERLNASSIVRQPSDRRQDINSTSMRSNGNSPSILNCSDLHTSLNASGASDILSGLNSSMTESSISTIPFAGSLAGCTINNNSVVDAPFQDLNKNEDTKREKYSHKHNKSAPVSVNRSESYKERLSNKRNRNSRRKTSDPNLSSRPKDETSDVGLSNNNYLPSSDSSPSPRESYESLSTSTEHIGIGTPACANISNVHHHSHQDSFHGSIGSAGSNNISFWAGNNSTGTAAALTRQFNLDSDDEDDLIDLDWSSMVSADILSNLTDAEKKRQEIINEIYQTERSHVRTLKLLDRLFYRSLQESGILNNEHLELLFPSALIHLCDLHGKFEQKLKQRRLEHNHVVNHVGDLLACMFDGPAGEELRELAAQFCARQQIALEALKEKRRKDEQLHKLLNKAESHKACRRLQLKDLLPTVLQRLTKYPLLFENLYKVTVRVLPENTNEAELVQQALESSKKILVDVNQAVKIAEDAHKLQNIQKKLDKSTFDKEEFKNLDLTQHRLIYDGNLTMKKIPGIQLHGLLFENMIILLTKQDDKYSLKNLQPTRNAEVNNKPINPIMSIDSETLVRQEAADKNSFFLIKTKTSQMLELRAPSSSDCKTWFKHISEAAEQYKSRSKNVTQESIDDPAIATIPHSNTKESFELQPDNIAPATATATIITTPLAPLHTPQTASASSCAAANDDTAINLQNDLNELSDAKSNQQHDYYNLGNNRLGLNELLPSNIVNRTLSTRSCGEAIGGSPRDDNTSGSNVTLRHTQSARKANANAPCSKDDFLKRDSASIVYSNNSNDTRTLLMQSPLVQPTAISISISPALTAEPVLTSSERLKRLDAVIQDGLMEKQKIICDMFRVPFEHFDEIVDIASMPEAPKDSADIALAAYDQIQNLTRVINDYMQVTPEQIISAVSTSICDKCNKNEKTFTSSASSHDSNASVESKIPLKSRKSVSASVLEEKEELPPPLPPPNKQMHKQKKHAHHHQQHQQHQHVSQKNQIAISNLPQRHPNIDNSRIHEDDDGYCEIDELRLPALPVPTSHPQGQGITSANYKPLPPLPIPTPPPLPPPPSKAKKSPSKPEAEESNAEAVIEDETSTENVPDSEDATTERNIPDILEDKTETEAIKNESDEPEEKVSAKVNEDDEVLNVTEDADISISTSQVDSKTTGDPETDVTPAEESNAESKQETLTEQQDGENTKPLELTMEETQTKMVDSSTQTVSSPISLKEWKPLECGPNRLQHAASLEPKIPCIALYNITNALNKQISLLLPKLNERDQEREQLRKENQHLRELLNGMLARRRTDKDDEETDDLSPGELKNDVNLDELPSKVTGNSTSALDNEHNSEEK